MSALGVSILFAPVVLALQEVPFSLANRGLLSLIAVGAVFALFEAVRHSTGHAVTVWVLLIGAVTIDSSVLANHIGNGVDASTPLGLLSGYLIRSNGITGVILAGIAALAQLRDADWMHFVVAVAGGLLLADVVARWGRQLQVPLQRTNPEVIRRVAAFVAFYLAVASYFAMANQVAVRNVSTEAFAHPIGEGFWDYFYYSLMVLAAGDDSGAGPTHPVTKALRASETVVGLFTLAVYLTLVMSDAKESKDSSKS